MRQTAAKLKTYALAACVALGIGASAYIAGQIGSLPNLGGQTALNSPAPSTASEGSTDPYDIAKSGGRHAGLLRQYEGKPDVQIQNALRSYKKNVVEHMDKLANPEKYVSDWASLDVRAQQGLLQHWQADLERNQEFVDIMKGILRAKGLTS